MLVGIQYTRLTPEALSILQHLSHCSELSPKHAEDVDIYLHARNLAEFKRQAEILLPEVSSSLGETDSEKTSNLLLIGREEATSLALLAPVTV